MKYDEVKVAVADYMAEHRTQTLARVRYDLARALGIGSEQPARVTFDGQVYRALERFVRDGLLVKRGPNRRLRYLTTEMLAERQAERERLAREAEANRAAEQAVRARLTAAGYHPRTSPGGFMSLAEWDALLIAAGIPAESGMVDPVHAALARAHRTETGNLCACRTPETHGAPFSELPEEESR